MNRDDKKIIVKSKFVDTEWLMGIDRKRILVCGNGFDLAHGLKTSYSDYMEFVEALYPIVDKCTVNANATEKSEIYRRLKDVLKRNEIKLDNSQIDSFYDEINEAFRQNVWLEYFIAVYESDRKFWNDLEAIIENALVKIKEGIKSGRLKIDGYIIDSEGFRLKEFLSDFNTGKLKDSNGNESLEKRLKDDYERFRDSLHIYLGLAYESKIALAAIRRDVECINPDYVVNFNYTDTFEKKYGDTSDAKVFYPHGKLKHIKKNNVVAGAELDLSDIGRILDELNKGHQRAKFGTDNGYSKVLDEAESQTIDTFFFGHSLCLNDRKILSGLLPKKEKGKIRNAFVYCTSDDDKSEKIKNAKALMGEEIFASMYNEGRIAFLDGDTEWEKNVKKEFF